MMGDVAGTNNPLLINETDLAKWLGYDQGAKIEQWLSDRGIPFDRSRGHVVTTIHAINSSLIGARDKDSGFEFR